MGAEILALQLAVLPLFPFLPFQLKVPTQLSATSQFEPSSIPAFCEDRPYRGLANCAAPLGIQTGHDEFRAVQSRFMSWTVIPIEVYPHKTQRFLNPRKSFGHRLPLVAAHSHCVRHHVAVVASAPRFAADCSAAIATVTLPAVTTSLSSAVTTTVTLPAVTTALNSLVTTTLTSPVTVSGSCPAVPPTTIQPTVTATATSTCPVVIPTNPSVSCNSFIQRRSYFIYYSGTGVSCVILPLRFGPLVQLSRDALLPWSVRLIVPFSLQYSFNRRSYHWCRRPF
ncbi:hypothetical protein K456DRAFT_41657 [Colletotrichum gloeosporioides 23]|nr:hypothetical protein K456DRAFT_41657 [Colletotrichum gloeosporioides 23]